MTPLKGQQARVDASHTGFLKKSLLRLLQEKGPTMGQFRPRTTNIQYRKVMVLIQLIYETTLKVRECNALLPSIANSKEQSFILVIGSNSSSCFDYVIFVSNIHIARIRNLKCYITVESALSQTRQRFLRQL